MKLGTSTWFSPLINLESALKLAKVCGYAAVEVAATRENLDFNPEELRGLLRRLSLDLSCLSLGVPFFRDPSKLNLHSPSLETRLKSRNYVFESIEYASKAGGRFVYLCSIAKDSGQTFSGANMLFKESLEKCVQYGQKYGILVALEPFPGGYFPSFTDAYQLSLDVPGLGLVYDLGHEVLCGNQIFFPITNPGMILDVHINNNDGISDKHWIPSKGTIQSIDYLKFFQYLYAIHYRGCFTIELAEVDENGSQLSRSAKFIDSLISDLELT